MLSFVAVSETAIAESSTVLDASAFMAGAAATVSAGTLDYDAKAFTPALSAATATTIVSDIADADAQASATLGAATASTAVSFGQVNITITPTAVTATTAVNDYINSSSYTLTANPTISDTTATTSAGTAGFDAKANITLDTVSADADLTVNVEDFADEDAQGTATVSGVSAATTANWDTVNGIYAVQVVYLNTDFERTRTVNIVPYGNYKVYVTRQDIIMAYKWPDLDPNEIQAYSVDWSRFLNTGDTISSVAWLVNGTITPSYGITDNLTLVQPTNTTTVATVRITGGTVGQRYKISCRVTTADGLIYERSINLTILEQ